MNGPVQGAPYSMYEAGERPATWPGSDPHAPSASSSEAHAGEREPDVLPELERRRLLLEWNDTALAYPDDGCIHEIFAAQAARAPEAVALSFEGQRRSPTARSTSAANRLAHALRRRGVGPDVLVGVCHGALARDGRRALGVLKAGGAYVPLDPEYPEDRLAFMLEDARRR